MKVIARVLTSYVIAALLTIVTLSAYVLGIRERDYGTVPLSVIGVVLLITGMVRTVYLLAIPVTLVVVPLWWLSRRPRTIVMVVGIIVLLAAAFVWGTRSVGVNDRLLFPMV